MKKRLLAGLLATSIALSISMGAFPAMAATNDDFVEDWEDAADFTADSYSSGYSSSEQLFDDIIFFDLDEEVDDTAAEVIAEEDANDSSDTEIDRAADSIEETEPEDEVQDTDAAEDRNDWEDSDKETKSGTQNPEEAGPSDAEIEEDVPDSWEETPKIDSDLEAAIASEDPFSYYDDNALEEEMDDDIAMLAAGKTMAHEDYAYTDVSSGTEYMVDLYTDHTAKIWKLTTSSGEAECILPSTIYYIGDDGVQEPDPYTVTELSLSYWSDVTSDNNNYNESRLYTPKSTPTGAVFVKHSAEFVLNNGTITGNCAYGGAGGGVAVMDELPTVEHGTAFTMNGGTISNNTASGYRCDGGGIYSCSNHVSLLGGRIENNSAYDGGGVYSEGNTEIYTTLHIQNALITGNTADQGGGLWFCPTGDAKLYMQNGAVIYGNTAASAGDDFASPEVAIGAGGNGGVTLPDYFPNGKVIQWFSDGFLYAPAGNRGTSGQGTRYNAVEYAKRVTGVQNEKKGLALKSVVSDGVSIPAVGSLIITGNQASHGGGGIGANGGVVIGESTSLSHSISVKKAWDNPGHEDTQPSGVTIHLKERDTGDIVSTAELTGENGWQYTFTNLPLSPNHYTVTEQPLEGYKATYYQDADGNFIITNTYLTTPTPDVPAVTISVPVEKKWVNDYKWERPASIHVSLWNGDAKVKEADLTADMGWTYTFEDLPKGTYSVTEDAVPGYETLIERSNAGGFIITNTYERPLDPEPIEPIDPIPPVDPPQEEIVMPPIVPETTGNEPSPPSTEETTSVPPTEPTEESTEESTEERSAESDPEESPIKETQETPSVSAKPPKLIQTGQTWWPVFLLMFAGAGLLVFGLYKRSKENIDHE